LEDGTLKDVHTMTVDPVCGMNVSTDGPHTKLADEIYWFCSRACRDEFTESPEHFLERR
jgi:YHS domain-containing protein